MSYNKTIFQGNLTRDIELKYTQSGSAIGNSGIAVNRKYKNKQGEQKEDVLFVDITFFGRTAEIANQYLRKGSSVLIDGYLKLDQWTAQDGTKRSRHTVTVENLQMLGSAGDHSQGHATSQNNVDDPNRHNVGGNMNKPSGHQPQPDQVVSGAGGKAVPVYVEGGQTTIPVIDISDGEVPF